MLAKRPIFTHLVPTPGEKDVQKPSDGSEDHDVTLGKRKIFTHLVPTTGEEDVQDSVGGSEDPNAKK